MSVFHFKYFSIQQSNSALKVGTDAMLLGAHLADNTYHSILDIGTGTGVLALMAKQKNPLAKVTAIDIDTASLIDCEFNFNHSPWASDFKIIQQNFLEFKPTTTYDCIVCNPPYYENGYLSNNSRTNTAKHVKEFTIEELFKKVNELLHPKGDFWVIFPFSSKENWLSIAQSFGLYPKSQITLNGKKDNPNRLIVQFCKTPQTVIYKTLTIRNSDNSYTKEYIELTKNFHNKSLI
ncbi:MAG TPA: methyltransferase [Taishania sp.]|nr:methyltransferase [Taishania sp.]